MGGAAASSSSLSFGNGEGGGDGAESLPLLWAPPSADMGVLGAAPVVLPVIVGGWWEATPFVRYGH